MTSQIRTITIDCHDPGTVARFWEQVLDFAEDPDDPNLPEHVEWLIQSADLATKLLFIQVPDPELPGKRIHLDLLPIDNTRAEEVARVEALGATQVADMINPDGSGWVVLADPEGNLFCVLRSDAEREASA